MRVLIFSKLLSETFLILRRNERDVLKKTVYWASCTINVNLNILGRFSKNPQISNLMKIRPVDTELFHADGRIINIIYAASKAPSINEYSTFPPPAWEGPRKIGLGICCSTF
jgi:hypothetical protein